MLQVFRNVRIVAYWIDCLSGNPYLEYNELNAKTITVLGCKKLSIFIYLRERDD